MAFLFGGRSKLVSGLSAGVLLVSTVAPSFAQGAGGLNVFTGASDATGPNTYVGRVETPRNNASIQNGASLLVSGWAADTTAQGWSGFDQMQVYSGSRDNKGTKVADGMVGLNRPDVAEFLGANFLHSGFSAVIPANKLPSGQQALYVYLHTASKGWYYKTVNVNQQAPLNLKFPTDPIVSWLRPSSGDIITNLQFGPVGNYLLQGFALDRNDNVLPNAPTKTNAPNTGAGNVGIQSVTIYADKLPEQAGYDPNVNNLGPTSQPSIAIAPTSVPSNHNIFNNNGCSIFGGPVTFCRGDVSVTANYGPNYTFAGWVKYWDQRTAQPDMFHTLYARAISSATGKSSTASVEVYVKSLPGNGGGSTDTTACGTTQFLKHQCTYRAP